MPDISLLELLKSGAHFGHNTSRWNPKMKPYIFTVRNNIHIIDLEKTRSALLKAADFVAETVKAGGTVLFVGTKRQSKEAIKQQAAACGMPYVNVRWLGGTFTNFRTIQKTIRKLEKLSELKASGEMATRYTKKERLLLEREMQKMEKLFEGIKKMPRLPEAIFVADVNYDEIAVKEAQKQKVPIVGVVDTNSNPEGITYPIPCNDDASKAIELVTGVIAQAVMAGRGQEAAGLKVQPADETAVLESQIPAQAET